MWNFVPVSFPCTVHVIKFFGLLHGDESYSLILVFCTSSAFFYFVDFFFNKVPENYKGFIFSIVKQIVWFGKKEIPRLMHLLFVKK